jgi:hypothetical protein
MFKFLPTIVCLVVLFLVAIVCPLNYGFRLNYSFGIFKPFLTMDLRQYYDYYSIFLVIAVPLVYYVLEYINIIYFLASLFIENIY